jgi:aspartyl-tRNA(Asn)/glutamyl-tRNA(Gln) amidotransferase subunit C
MATSSQLDVSHLAELARMHLTSAEVERFGRELEHVLTYVEQLQNTDTEGVEETAQVTGLVNVLRDDDERSAISDQRLEERKKQREKLLEAVPETEATMVKVPVIIGQES